MSYRILVCDEIAEAGFENLKREAEVIRSDDSKYLGKVDAIIVRSRTKVTRELVSRSSPRLRVIGRAGVGVDNIDLDAAQEQGIIVVNTPEATTISVAEHTLGLILSLAHNIPQGNQSMKEGSWEKANLRGLGLYNKTLGIIGMGRIGSTLARLAAGFNMTILGYDVNLNENEIRSQGAEPIEFEDLLKRSDYVSLHVSLSETTKGLINAEALSKMKPSAHLISTSRGGVIDESALLNALESDEIAAAALDVFENEPPGITPLIMHPRVIVTPHIAAQTEESQTRTALDIASEVLAALMDKPLRWRII